MKKYNWVEIRIDNKYKFDQIIWELPIKIGEVKYDTFPIRESNPVETNIIQVLNGRLNVIINAMVWTSGVHSMRHKVFENVTETHLDLAWNKLYDNKLEIDVKHPPLEQLAPHIRQCVLGGQKCLYENVSRDVQRVVVDPICHTINNICWRHIAVSICSALRKIRLSQSLPKNNIDDAWNKL